MKGSIKKRGDTYTIIFSFKDPLTNKRRQKWKGGFKTKAEAQKMLTKALYEVDAGIYIEPNTQRLKEYLDEWLEDYCKVHLKVKTVDGYRSYINNHIDKALGKVRLCDLAPIHVQKFYDGLLKTGGVKHSNGLSPTTVIQCHRILRKALERARKLKIIPENPCDFVDLPKKVKFKVSIYNEEELKELIYVSKNSEIYIPILLGVFLGVRRGEALGLTWDNIDFEKKEIHIRKALLISSEGLIFDTPKTESGIRTLLASDFLLEELKKEKEKQLKRKALLRKKYTDMNLVCCYSDGNPFNPGRFSHKFADLLKNNKLEHIRFHDLRHSNATLLLKMNIPIKIASTRLGHSNIAITSDIYQHVDIDMQKDSADKMNEVLRLREEDDDLIENEANIEN